MNYHRFSCSTGLMLVWNYWLLIATTNGSNLITGDEKWVLYNNHERRRQWLSAGQTGIATPKTDLDPKKVMLSV